MCPGSSLFVLVDPLGIAGRALAPALVLLGPDGEVRPWSDIWVSGMFKSHSEGSWAQGLLLIQRFFKHNFSHFLLSHLKLSCADFYPSPLRPLSLRTTSSLLLLVEGSEGHRIGGMTMTISFF